MATPIQDTNEAQPNTDSGLQQQNENNLPSTQTSSDLQTNANDVNNIRQTELKVTAGPKSLVNKASSGTVLSIVLVAVILVVAGGLFIASLRVKDEEKAKDGMPSVAVGGEENGSLGVKKKNKFRRNKKNS